MQKQDSFMKRHWIKAAAAIAVMAGGYFGYQLYESRAVRKQSVAAQKQEDMNEMGIAPLVMNELFKGREVGLYQAWLPFATGKQLCALRVEYNGDSHRSVTIDYCLPPQP